MAASKRTKIQRERDLLIIAERYVKGQTQSEIAEVIGVSFQQISYDLKVIQRRWCERCAEQISEQKARELAKIDQLEREYWGAWQRSCDQRSIKQATVNAEGVESKSLRQEERDGNPAYLDGVLKCIEKRCKLMGLDAPEKRELTGKDGGPIEIADAKERLLSRINSTAARIGEGGGDSEPE